jgi:hypothetical protein
LIRFETAGRGRGSRTLYVLCIGETTAVERSFDDTEETTAVERSITPETTAGMTARMTAVERSRITDTGESSNRLSYLTTTRRERTCSTTRPRLPTRH